jgi:hypothetical protein
MPIGWRSASDPSDEAFVTSTNHAISPQSKFRRIKMATFDGDLSLLSSGIGNGWSNSLRVPAMQIGGQTLRSTIMHDELFSLLVPGQSYNLSFGRILFWRWLLRIEAEGETHRCPIMSFLYFNAFHAWLSGLIAGGLSGILFRTHDAQGLIGLAIGIALFGMNVRDWLK